LNKKLFMLIGITITMVLVFEFFTAFKSGSIFQLPFFSGDEVNSALNTDSQESIETLLIPDGLGVFFEEKTQQKNTDILPIIAEFQYILEEKKQEGGYTIETYREYEIYTDETGTIIKQVPTSNFEYLKYKQ
jgi:hypothetical protein